jgi:hypothetical protein
VSTECFYTIVIPLLRKRPALVRSGNGDFYSVQDAAEISTDLLGIRKA